MAVITEDYLRLMSELLIKLGEYNTFDAMKSYSTVESE